MNGNFFFASSFRSTHALRLSSVRHEQNRKIFEESILSVFQQKMKLLYLVVFCSYLQAQALSNKTCTFGGTECVFPFTYDGKQYNSCISSFLGEWCGIRSNVQEVVKHVDYDYCMKECPPDFQCTVEGYQCHFPFIFENVNHTMCLPQPLGKPWCGITYDSTHWGVCADTCPKTGSIIFTTEEYSSTTDMNFLASNGDVYPSEWNPVPKSQTAVVSKASPYAVKTPSAADMKSERAETISSHSDYTILQTVDLRAKIKYMKSVSTRKNTLQTTVGMPSSEAKRISLLSALKNQTKKTLTTAPVETLHKVDSKRLEQAFKNAVVNEHDGFAANTTSMGESRSKVNFSTGLKEGAVYFSTKEVDTSKSIESVRSVAATVILIGIVVLVVVSIFVFIWIRRRNKARNAHLENNSETLEAMVPLKTASVNHDLVNHKKAAGDAVFLNGAMTEDNATSELL